MKPQLISEEITDAINSKSWGDNFKVISVDERFVRIEATFNAGTSISMLPLITLMRTRGYELAFATPDSRLFQFVC